ncbi:MAG: hypothetical protein ABIP78_05565, partial [Pyrinomonadaceae bacterium]
MHEQDLNDLVRAFSLNRGLLVVDEITKRAVRIEKRGSRNNPAPPFFVYAGTGFIPVPGWGLYLSSVAGAASNSGLLGGGGVPHLARMNTAWNVLAALRVKSTGSAGFGTKNVTTTGAVVPGVNAGIVTIALTGTPTTV